MNDRRRHYRTDCRIAACIMKRGVVNADLHCSTSNIGMKGLYLPHAPHHPVGAYCKLVIQDHPGEPLIIDAKVSHHYADGLGLTFVKPHLDQCMRLRHLVKPYWDQKNYLEGMMLVMRYAHPAVELKDALKLTSLLSVPSDIFSKSPYTKGGCALFH